MNSTDTIRRLLAAPVLALVPHFDDEVLGFGGTLLKANKTSDIHFLYATDAGGSETNHIPGVKSELTRDIRDIRREESVAALQRLGIAMPSMTIMDIPDYGVAANAARIRDAARAMLQRTGATVVLAPFRYDRHPDHVALNRIACDLIRQSAPRQVTLVEYFVYFQWRMLPGGDVRRWVRPECMAAVPIDDVAGDKHAALMCHQSQTTLSQSWQTHPVLGGATIDLFTRGPEMFCTAGLIPDRMMFRLPLSLIRFCHWVEPWLKTRKELWRYKFVR